MCSTWWTRNPKWYNARIYKLNQTAVIQVINTCPVAHLIKRKRMNVWMFCVDCLKITFLGFNNFPLQNLKEQFECKGVSTQLNKKVKQVCEDGFLCVRHFLLNHDVAICDCKTETSPFLLCHSVISFDSVQCVSLPWRELLLLLGIAKQSLSLSWVFMTGVCQIYRCRTFASQLWMF